MVFKATIIAAGEIRAAIFCNTATISAPINGSMFNPAALDRSRATEASKNVVDSFLVTFRTPIINPRIAKPSVAPYAGISEGISPATIAITTPIKKAQLPILSLFILKHLIYDFTSSRIKALPTLTKLFYYSIETTTPQHLQRAKTWSAMKSDEVPVHGNFIIILAKLQKNAEKFVNCYYHMVATV